MIKLYEILKKITFNKMLERGKNRKEFKQINDRKQFIIGLLFFSC